MPLMTDNTYTQALIQLQVAAQGREWTTLQDTFKQLVTNLDPLIALSVVAPRVQAFIPKFQHYYPEAKWVRELMLTVIAYGSSPNDLPVHAVRDFPSPGCGNFLLAVFDLARTVQPHYSVFERYSHITNAAANAILAHLQYTYFKKRLDLYAILRDSETDEVTRQQIQHQFWLDEDVARTDTALWLNLIETLTVALENN
jgi:hypothetical protein